MAGVLDGTLSAACSHLTDSLTPSLLGDTGVRDSRVTGWEWFVDGWYVTPCRRYGCLPETKATVI